MAMEFRLRTQQANVSRTTSETGRVAGWQLLPICRRLEEELREAQPHDRVVAMDDVVLPLVARWTCRRSA
jgi:hypothetical protein